MGVTDFIDNHLKTTFRWFGGFVANHKAWFIVLPCLLALGLSAGLLRLKFASDPAYLLTPVNGEGRQELALAEKYFPTNFSHYDAVRSVKLGKYGYVMITSRRKHASVLDIEEWMEVRNIERLVLDIQVEHEGSRYRYEDICAKWKGGCYTNSLFNVADTFAVINKGFLSGPLHSFETNIHNLSQQLGLNLSMDSLPGLQTQLLKEQNLANVRYNSFVKQALTDLRVMSEDLLYQFDQHVRPVLDAINLPAYLGGLTWLNRGLKEADICSLVTFPGVNSTARLCNNPMDFMNTVLELGQEVSTKREHVIQALLHHLKLKLKEALANTDVDVDTHTQIYQDVISSLRDKIIDLATRLQYLEEIESSNMSQLFKAEAILIIGLLDSDTFPEVSRLWELEFLRTIDSLDLKYTEATPLVSASLELEMSKTTERMVPILGVNIFAMVIFSMAVCCTRNIIHSKPWVGLAGVISTLLATVSGFGLLTLCGAEFTSFNFGAVFIMVGIGLDDTFVVLNSWQRTDRKASVAERLGETLSESGVSILITSLTDAVSFFTAIMAPYPYVKIFCLYSGVCIVFLFLYQITFFTACLAWSGEHEAEERSGLSLRKVNSSADNKFKGCLCFDFGEYQVDVPQSEERKMKLDIAEQAARITRFVLRSRSVRIIILAAFIGYIAVSIYGLLNVKVFFDKTKLINYDSSMAKFVELEDKLFRGDAYAISIILTGDFNYTDKAVMNRIERLLVDLESLEHINPHMTKSWLQHYDTMAAAKLFLFNETDNIRNKMGEDLTEQEFVKELHEFFAERDTPFSMDVTFNKEINRIVASRFMVQGQNIHSSTEEKALAISVREICAKHSDSSMKVTPYNTYFIYTDQYITVFSQTLQCVLTTGITVIAISLVLLPDLFTALSTVLSVVSTLIGTIGLMSMWGIEIDGITLINLVMCIGFSVDFSAHFSYHYIDKKKKMGGDSDVVDQSVVAVVKPILQAAVSTILGLVGLVKAPSAGFIIFFKMIFIVISLGLVHSLVLLPCLLQFLVDVRTRFKRRAEPVVLLSIRQITEEAIIKSKVNAEKADIYVIPTEEKSHEIKR